MVANGALKIVETLPEPAVIVSENYAATNGIWRNIAIGYGRKAPDLAAAQDYRALLEQLIREHGSPVGVITVIEDTSTPTAEARDAMLQMFRELWMKLDCIAFVIQARGFSAAAQRAVLSALLMVSGMSGRLKIFADAQSAVTWLANQLLRDQPQSERDKLSTELSLAIREFCRQHRDIPVSLRAARK